jgi:hypothetical protein
MMVIAIATNDYVISVVPVPLDAAVPPLHCHRYE